MKRISLLIAVFFLLAFQAANGEAATTKAEKKPKFKPKKEVMTTSKIFEKEGKLKGKRPPKPPKGGIIKIGK